MKIFMLDAACNTMPYDHSLCEALSKNGHNVNFFASTYVHTDWTQQQSYNYPVANSQKQTHLTRFHWYVV